MLVRLTVRDAQENAPVAGAEVRRESTGEVVGYTDGRGQVATSQQSFETDSYYVNATDGDAYDQAAGDVTTAPLTFAGYDPVVSSVTPELADGDVFDPDEYAPGDVALVVRDQFQRPIDEPTDVAYRLYPDGVQPPNGFQVVQTAAGTGRVALPFTPGTSSRDFLLDFRLGSDPSADGGYEQITFRTGQATLALTPDGRRGPVRRPGGGHRHAGGRGPPAGRSPHRPALRARGRGRAGRRPRRRPPRRRQPGAAAGGGHRQPRAASP